MSARRNCSAWNLSERLAEGAALAGVGERLVERGLGAAEGGGGDVEPAAVEAGHGVAEAVALGAEQVLGRDRAGVELHLGGRLRLPAHLALLGAEGEAGGAGLDEEGGDALRAVAAGAGHDEVEVGEAAAGDEGLGAVEASSRRRCGWRGCAAPRRRSRSRARSGSRRSMRSSATSAGQVAGAGGLGAPGRDHPGAHVVDRDEGSRRPGRPRPAPRRPARRRGG